MHTYEHRGSLDSADQNGARWNAAQASTHSKMNRQIVYSCNKMIFKNEMNKLQPYIQNM